MDDKQINTGIRKLAKATQHAGGVNPQELAAKLRELEAYNSREVKLLVDAAKADVLEDLSTPVDGSVRELLVERLSSRVLTESDASHEEARWAVETWAKALSGKAAVIEHAHPSHPPLDWGVDEGPTAPSLNDLRTSAPIPATGSALPTYSTRNASQANVQAGASWPPPPLRIAEDEALIENTSGLKGDVPTPICDFRWNWGAFFWGPWWLMFNGMVFWGIILLVLGFAVHGLLAIAASLYLGFSGHKLAWRHRRFEGVEQYLTVQRAWSRSSLIYVAVLTVLLLAIAIPNFIRGYNQGRAERAYELSHPAP